MDLADGVWTTPLLMACQSGYEACTRLLLEGGAAVDQADKGGVTPLKVAREEGHEAVVQLLLEHGASGEGV